jgi:phosphoglycolate phosphatase
MGVLPGECLMIGDTTVDILAAKAAGAQSSGVLCGFGERAELNAAGADIIIDTTKDIVVQLKI